MQCVRGQSTAKTKSMSRDTNTTEILSALLKQRIKLNERLCKIKSDLRSGLNKDSEEQAIELENHDVLLEIERVTSIELAKLEKQISDLSNTVGNEVIE